MSEKQLLEKFVLRLVVCSDGSGTIEINRQRIDKEFIQKLIELCGKHRLWITSEKDETFTIISKR